MQSDERGLGIHVSEAHEGMYSDTTVPNSSLNPGLSLIFAPFSLFSTDISFFCTSNLFHVEWDFRHSPFVTPLPKLKPQICSVQFQFNLNPRPGFWDELLTAPRIQKSSDTWGSGFDVHTFLKCSVQPSSSVQSQFQGSENYPNVKLN